MKNWKIRAMFFLARLCKSIGGYEQILTFCLENLAREKIYREMDFDRYSRLQNELDKKGSRYYFDQKKIAEIVREILTTSPEPESANPELAEELKNCKDYSLICESPEYEFREYPKLMYSGYAAAEAKGPAEEAILKDKGFSIHPVIGSEV